jgi:hypothetical protein
MALELTQPPIQWVLPGALSLEVKRRETDRSPPSSAEVKEWVELYLHSPNTPPWCGAQLKHRDNFTLPYGAKSPSWEANSHSAIQKLPWLLWNPKLHYRVQKGPPLVPILSQMNSVHTLPPYLTKIHSNFIFPSTPRSSKMYLIFRLTLLQYRIKLRNICFPWN